MPILNELFYFDGLAKIISTLVLFIGICVASFASRYLKGDRNYKRFFIVLSLLVVTVILMVCSNNLALLIILLVISDLLLIRLMVHKKKWREASESGKLAFKTLLIGFVSILIAFALFYSVTGSLNIQTILQARIKSNLMLLALALIVIAAMTQSGIWPFHKWLTSSLNSPTPVSAVMHAGLINGGGFLLARFAPLYLQQPRLLTVIFAIGFITALFGTLWKLMQSDIKRILACSTMGQMGFMIAQAGLGLFPAAIAHLFWHGMFKAYLFLASGAAAQNKSFDLEYPPTAKVFILAILCGLVGSYGFAFASGKIWLATNTSLVLIVVALISGTQMAMMILKKSPFKMLPIALIVTAIMGMAYGTSINLVQSTLNTMNIMQPQPLNIIHIIAILILTCAWLSMVFYRSAIEKDPPKWLLKLYVKTLNSSQPHPKTVTSDRNTYNIL